MSPELQNQLHDKYPHFGTEWRCEHSDGWYNIIDALLSAMSRNYINALQRLDSTVKRAARDAKGPPPYAINDYVPVTEADIAEEQIKVTEALANLPKIVQVKEKFGTLRFYATSDNFPNLYSLIYFAEQMSAHTCEVCGNRGSLKEVGWWRTLCDKHYEQYKTRD